MTENLVAGLAGLFLLLLIYDFVAFKIGGGRATITTVLQEAGARRPAVTAILCFVVGSLFGHLYL